MANPPASHRLDRALLQGTEAFAGLRDEALDEVLQQARPRRYERNAIVFEQGAAAHSFFVLLDGRLKVVQSNADGQQVLVRFVNPGELFGIAAAIGRTEYPGTAVAAAESVALAWPMRYWAELVSRFPSVATNTLRVLGGRLQEQHTKVQEIATQRIERRVAQVLLRLIRQAGRKVETGVLIDFPLTRQDLAELTATTLFTVSRIMSAWEQSGIATSERQRILVRDPHRLLQIAEDMKDAPETGR